MTLDLTTLTLVMMALALSSTLVFLLIWLINRQMPGVLLWFISSCLMLGSVITNLLSTLVELPPGVGAVVSNSLSLSGGILILEGALRFRGWTSARRWQLVLCLIPVFVFLSWLNRFDAPARYMVHDTIMLVISLGSATALLWKPTDLEEFWTHLMAATGNLFMAVVAGGRAGVAIFNSDSVAAGLSSTGTQWYLFAAIMFYMSWTFGLSVACYSRSRREVMQLAREDDLTGLPNRRSLDERLAMAMADARRSREGFAVIMMDVNGFKRVNDELGHRAGDELLIELAARLRHALREVDYAGRLGGDEFLIIVRGDVALKGLDMLVERLHNYLEGAMELRDGRVDVKISMGIAEWVKDSDTIDGLLRMADARMYQQKHAKERVSDPVRKLDASPLLN
ncbi:MAG: GGDEF domain-containing protein [Pseudohongiella sp.]|nr:GGDEF domain-containing protein [Pseudohongiella sp.]MDO9521256.1 GGDEF domain-containing protein [Pseudohongiella sp.]MDP2127287.1 GGDEF domain-containing protein [Pseudohongiella sp.]